MYYPCSENKGADQLRGYAKTGFLTTRLIFQHKMLNNATSDSGLDCLLAGISSKNLVTMKKELESPICLFGFENKSVKNDCTHT